MKPRIIAFIIIALLIVAGGVYLSRTNTQNMHMPNSGSGTTATPSSPNSVLIASYAYSPTPLKVKKGTTVTWTNQDIAKHTVTVDSGTGPDSQLFGKGESFTYTFDTVGTYHYHCQPHPYMKGTVEVVE